MRGSAKRFYGRATGLAVAIFGILLAGHANASISIEGMVVDTNGNPVSQAQVIYQRGSRAIGANVVTVFTDSRGVFSFPDAFPESVSETTDIQVRALGIVQTSRLMKPAGQDRISLIFTTRAIDNQAAVAPASAWLARLQNRQEQSKFIMDCIDCHQVPAPEVRNYAGSIADLHADDPALARTQSWNAIVKYMNFLSAWEFSRGDREATEQVDTDAVYSVENGEETAAHLPVF